jgi:hypothetical protein
MGVPEILPDRPSKMDDFLGKTGCIHNPGGIYCKLSLKNSLKAVHELFHLAFSPLPVWGPDEDKGNAQSGVSDSLVTRRFDVPIDLLLPASVS